MARLEAEVRRLTEEVERYRGDEENLRRSEEMYRTLIEQSLQGVVIVITDDPPRMAFANAAMSGILGYRLEELRDMSLEKAVGVVHPDDRPMALQRFQDRVAGKPLASPYECRIIRKDGEIRWLEVYSTAIAYRSKPAIEVFAADITQRKQAEEALRESEAKYRRLFENIHDVFYRADLTGAVTLISPSSLRTVGYRAEEVIGTNARDYFVQPEDWERFLEAVIRDGYVENFEARMRRKDGTVVWGSSSARLVYDQEGRACGLEGTARDITKRKLYEETLSRHKKDLESKSRQLEEMNAALKILLKRRDEDRADLEESVLSNVRELVLPYLEKLGQTRLDEEQKILLGILGSHINDIVSPFIHKISSRFLQLTPTEVQVAQFIRQGRSTKEIAAILRLSHNTVVSHRYHLRDKLGLKGRKVNLKTYLRTLAV